MKALKLIIIIFFLVICTYIFTIPVSADMGPKPTSVIEIIGIDEPYYFDLLVHYENTIQPLTVDDIFSRIEHEYYAPDYPDILNGYQDDEGFASYTLYINMPHYIHNDNLNEFIIGYFAAPDVFKIAIVTESNNVFISDTITKTYFSAHFTYDFSNDSVLEQAANQTNTFFNDTGIVTEDFPYLRVIATALLGVLITLIIEIFILYIAQYREKATYKIVIVTNICTQLILHICIFFGSALWSIFAGIGILILGEFLVLIIEMIVYRILFQEKQKLKPVPYAILANLASFILGLLILFGASAIFA